MEIGNDENPSFGIVPGILLFAQLVVATMQNASAMEIFLRICPDRKGEL